MSDDRAIRYQVGVQVAENDWPWRDEGSLLVAKQLLSIIDALEARAEKAEAEEAETLEENRKLADDVMSQFERAKKAEAEAEQFRRATLAMQCRAEKAEAERDAALRSLREKYLVERQRADAIVTMLSEELGEPPPTGTEEER